MLVTDVMTRHPVSITSDWRVKQAAILAAEEEVSSLPVVDRHGHICGIVNDADLIRDTGRVVGMVSRSDVVRASVLQVGGRHVEVAVPRLDRAREVVADRRHQAKLGS